MIKTLAGAMWVGAFAILANACGNKSNANDHACKTGALACQCYANDTCDKGLTCLATLCIDLTAGLGGAASLPGGGGDTGEDDSNEGGSAGEDATTAGSGGTGGNVNVGGNTTGGSITTGGSGGGGNGGGGGTGGATLFPPDPAGCALVSTCPTCCETTGVFALDTLDKDATSRYVTAFDVTSSAATAEFDFATSGEVGAIFFHFSSPQDIGALSISGIGTGGTLEIALVRANGKDGCIYPVSGGTLSSTPSTCWGLGAGPYAALAADQIEIRVRSLTSGRAAINVSTVQYAP